ncbi:MAG: hypothetical protein ACYS6W_04355 [Planctomycetota bacterium]|jgi:hypothetical protein
MRLTYWILAAVAILAPSIAHARLTCETEAQFGQKPASPYSGLQSDFDYLWQIDNFTSTGPITTIEFWGYWLDDFGDPVDAPTDYGFNFFFYADDGAGKIDSSAIIHSRNFWTWYGDSGSSQPPRVTNTGKVSPEGAAIVKYSIASWTKSKGPVDFVGDGWLNINGFSEPIFYWVKSPDGDNVHVVTPDFEPAKDDLAFCLGGGKGESEGVRATPEGKGLAGEWEMKLNFEGGQVTSILSFAKDKEGKLTAQWVSLMGISEVEDIKRKGKDITFVVISRFGDEEYRSNFIGTLEQGKLSGLLTSDSSEFTTEGKKIKPMPPILGSWNMTFTIGERQINTVLVIAADKQNKLQAEWKSQRGEHEISDVQFKAGKLTLNLVSKVGDRRWESTYEGTLKGHKLTGTIKSERGEIAANGKRAGAPLVGKWDLTMTSERGTQRQRLTVHPDLSARYGSFPIRKVRLDERQVSFDMALEFGERKYEMSFKGELDAGKLTGQFTTPRGTSEVTGKKIAPTRKKK